MNKEKVINNQVPQGDKEVWCPKSKFQIGIIVFCEYDLIAIEIQGLPLSTASLVLYLFWLSSALLSSSSLLVPGAGAKLVVKVGWLRQTWARISILFVSQDNSLCSQSEESGRRHAA